MEMNDLLNKIYELRDLILKSTEYCKTKEIENSMMNDIKFARLSNAFINAQNDYNECVKLGLDSTEKQQVLLKAKEELYSYEKVRDYFDYYHLTNEMLKNISKTREDVLKCEL